MRDTSELTVGNAHVGNGGVQGWSAGDVYPWVIYTVAHYAPDKVFRAGQWHATGLQKPGGRPAVQWPQADGTGSAAERFLWAEIRMKHPDGSDVLLAHYYAEEKGADAHRIAHCMAQQRAIHHATRAYSIQRAHDAIKRLLGYGVQAEKRRLFIHEG